MWIPEHVHLLSGWNEHELRTSDFILEFYPRATGDLPDWQSWPGPRGGAFEERSALPRRYEWLTGRMASARSCERDLTSGASFHLSDGSVVTREIDVFSASSS